MNKTLVIVGSCALLLVVLVFHFLHSKTTFTVMLLPSKPSSPGVYIKNPDIIYSSDGFLSLGPAASPTEFLNESSDWKGTAFILSSVPMGGRKGVALIHPFDVQNTRKMYIEQELYLPSGNYKLLFGIADVADSFPPEFVANMGWGGFTGNCADVGIKVIVTDVKKEKEYVIFDKVIRNGRWYDYSVDISSHFSGEKIKVRVESYPADKGCGIWNGEWAAVDYVIIQPY